MIDNPVSSSITESKMENQEIKISDEFTINGKKIRQYLTPEKISDILGVEGTKYESFDGIKTRIVEWKQHGVTSHGERCGYSTNIVEDNVVVSFVRFELADESGIGGSRVAIDDHEISSEYELDDVHGFESRNWKFDHVKMDVGSAGESFAKLTPKNEGVRIKNAYNALYINFSKGGTATIVDLFFDTVPIGKMIRKEQNSEIDRIFGIFGGEWKAGIIMGMLSGAMLSFLVAVISFYVTKDFSKSLLFLLGGGVITGVIGACWFGTAIATFTSRGTLAEAKEIEEIARESSSTPWYATEKQAQEIVEREISKDPVGWFQRNSKQLASKGGNSTNAIIHSEHTSREPAYCTTENTNAKTKFVSRTSMKFIFLSSFRWSAVIGIILGGLVTTSTGQPSIVIPFAVGGFALRFFLALILRQFRKVTVGDGQIAFEYLKIGWTGPRWYKAQDSIRGFSIDPSQSLFGKLCNYGDLTYRRVHGDEKIEFKALADINGFNEAMRDNCEPF